MPSRSKPSRPTKPASKSARPTKTASKTARPTKTASKTARAKVATRARSIANPATADEKKRVSAISQGLDAMYPNADCELDYKNPLQLLVATIMSAQTTDKRVNMVTPTLFAKYPTAAALAAANPEDVEDIIKSTGFFRNKAKSIIGTAAKLVSDFGGEVPKTLEAIITLPGAARKTANVVLGTAYGIASGFVVDTHVMRLSHRLRLSNHKDPVDIEQDLMVRFPKERWVKTGHQLIWHGRRVCDAKKPKCSECPLAKVCPSAFNAV